MVSNTRSSSVDVRKHIAGWDLARGQRMGCFSAEFVEQYNQDLALLRCDARVAEPNGAWHRGSLAVIDKDGFEIGIVPNTVEPIELAAFARLLDKRFDQGVARGAQLKDHSALIG